MQRSDIWGMPPGLTGAIETYEAAFRWGPAGLGLIQSGYINSVASDPTNTPTFELRPGLVMGLRTDGTWSNYNPAATDGSQTAAGVNLTGLRMTDILTQAAIPKFYGILVGGPVQASKLIGLDFNARQAMSEKFMFDDPGLYPATHYYPFRGTFPKTANYQATVADTGLLFTNAGAVGAVVITLPPIQNGLFFGIRADVAQSLQIASFEGGNLIGTAATNTSATVVAIGGGVVVFSNSAGTKWEVQNISSYQQVVTFA